MSADCRRVTPNCSGGRSADCGFTRESRSPEPWSYWDARAASLNLRNVFSVGQVSSRSEKLERVWGSWLWRYEYCSGRTILFLTNPRISLTFVCRFGNSTEWGNFRNYALELACAFAAAACASSSVFKIICKACIVPSGGVISSFNRSYINLCRVGNFYNQSIHYPRLIHTLPAKAGDTTVILIWVGFFWGVKTWNAFLDLCCLSLRRDVYVMQNHYEFLKAKG